MSNKQYFKYFLIFLLVAGSCDHRSPVNPENAAELALQLNFRGYPVRNGAVQKISNRVFTHLTVEIYADEFTPTRAFEVTPIAASTIEIDSASTAFEGRLTLPAGENRFLLARLFESLDDSMTILDSTAVSYCGKVRDLTIHAGQINEITLDLFPVPIKNRRVVFSIESAPIDAEYQTAEIPVRLASLDSIRGIQFDLTFEPSVAATDSMTKAEATLPFSNVQFNDLPTGGTRFLVFDQTANSPWLVPLGTACADPTPLFKIHVNITDPNQEIIQISMERAVVSPQNFAELDVFVIPGRIFR